MSQRPPQWMQRGLDAPPDHTGNTGDAVSDTTEPELDTGGTTSPVRGQPEPTDPEPDPEPTEESNAETGDLQRTSTTTSPVAGQAPPEETYQEPPEGLSSSEAATLREEIASQEEGVFYQDVSLRREELSDDRVEELREREAEERGVSPDRIEFEETPYQIRADISERGVERAAETDIASRYAGVEPTEIQVDIENGGTETSVITPEARQDVIEQSGLGAEMRQEQTTTESPTDVSEVQERATEFAQSEDTVVSGSGMGDTVGRTTDPTYAQRDTTTTTEFINQQFGFDVFEATDVTTETLTERPIDSTVEGFETLAAGAGIDYSLVDASRETGQELVTNPIGSTRQGFEELYEGGEETAEELSQGIGPGTAAVPAAVTGTGTAAGVSSAGAAGAATVGAIVAIPAGVAYLGIEGIEERGIQAPEVSEESELPATDPNQSVSEVPIGERQTDEIDPTDFEQTSEITVDEQMSIGGFERQGEIDVSEPESDAGIEADAVVDQPTSGFEDLPRDEEIGEPEVTDESQNEYAQEEPFLFPGETAGDESMVEIDENIGTQLGYEYGSELLDGTRQQTGFGSIPGVATDTVSGVGNLGMAQPTPTAQTTPDLGFEDPTVEASAYNYGFEYGFENANRNPQSRRLPDIDLDFDADRNDTDTDPVALDTGITIGEYIDIL